MTVCGEVVKAVCEEQAAEDKCLHSVRTGNAASIRGALVDKWREECKPRKQGTIAPQPRGCKVDFDPLFKKWLAARGLDDALERVENQRGWFVYRYKRKPVVESEYWWDQAFHGTWWYPLWSILESGVMLASDDKALGHDFWEPGVYCSPKVETGRWYARPQVMFEDGCYHRVMLELRVDPERRKKNRARGGIQWVFNSDAVSIYGLWVQVNAPPVKGEERLNDWDPALEALPLGQSIPAEVKNTRTGPWPVPTEPDDDTEDWTAPHLHESAPKASDSDKDEGWMWTKSGWKKTSEKDGGDTAWKPPWMTDGNSGDQWSSGNLPPWMLMMKAFSPSLAKDVLSGFGDFGNGSWGKDKWTNGKDGKWNKKDSDKDEKWQKKKNNDWNKKASSSSSAKMPFQVGEKVQFNSGTAWEDGIVTSTQPLLVRYEILPDQEGLEYDEVRKHPDTLRATQTEASASSSATPTFKVGEKVQFNSGTAWEDGIVTSTQPLLVRYEILPDQEGLEYDEVRKHPSTANLIEAAPSWGKNGSGGGKSNKTNSEDDECYDYKKGRCKKGARCRWRHGDSWNPESSSKPEASSGKASASSSATPTFKLGERVQFNSGTDWEDGIVTSTQPLLVRYEILPDQEGLEYEEVRKHPDSAKQAEAKDNGNFGGWLKKPVVGAKTSDNCAASQNGNGVGIVPLADCARTVPPPKRKAGEADEPEAKQRKVVDE